MTGPREFHSIFARNCCIQRISREQAKTFLDKYHLYGWAVCKYRYGIFVQRYSGKEMLPDAPHPYPVGTLVAVATFSNARHWDKVDYSVRSCQWIRYASLPGVRVLGGMGKVLNHFIDEVHPDDVMTYAPLESFTGEAYLELGFVSEGIKDFGDKKSEKFRFKVPRKQC